eukprot:TRINITY_DN9160_c0_g1_i1.p1 TRINITY_DN9160_c0_g1~~TRINITY_DN9160_c0_g1_i1.p1  ORF type:complete len:454 (+),score=98.32 TRINITY_DN9160_c0_g1_i1:65-1426(+)
MLQAAFGNVVASGLPQVVGFHKTLETMMVQGGLKPWSPKQLLQARLQRQQDLASTSPLRFIDVQVGLQSYERHLGFISALTREKFVQASLELFAAKGLVCPPEEACMFYDVFDAISMYHNASLCMGEMAGGLSSFFGASVEQRAQAVYALLAGGKHVQLTKSSMRDLVKPYVWASVPDEAQVLRPLLLTHVTDELFDDITSVNAHSIGLDEFIRWVTRGHQTARQATGLHNPIFAHVVVAQVARSIETALQTAWREHDVKMQLQAYGQQTWEQNHDGQQQLIRDVGLLRYISTAATASESPLTWGSIVQQSSQLYTTAAEAIGNTRFNLWERRCSVESLGSASVVSSMRRRSSTVESLMVEDAELASSSLPSAAPSPSPCPELLPNLVPPRPLAQMLSASQMVANAHAQVQCLPNTTAMTSAALPLKASAYTTMPTSMAVPFKVPVNPVLACR